ncbi:Hpt domain-containing protein [Mesonia sp. HuA40]|uniref:Hpt domain-containing protein n=1 Tax=Mesonia sp. HuA40 TaxID=2602761 RepID=UPI0011CA5497|nr:Hpt domain-containing protein [Mesonia sp. HuA40]TXK74259.1 Hpt domain-containing protein [Mesonia sp. HuA40]
MKLYNLDDVREMAAGDSDFIKEIVHAFLEEVPIDITQLYEAVQNENKPMVYAIAHKVKPNLQLFGLGLSHEIKQLEGWGKEQESYREDEILAIARRVKDTVLMATEALHKELD